MPTPSLSTPEAAVEGLSRALAARRWRDAVAFLDQASVSEFHRSQIELLPQRTAHPSPLTADHLMRHDPEMPRAVAEYTVRQHRRHQENHLAHPEHDFAGIRSWAEIATLAPDDLVGRWLEAQDPVYELRRTRARSGRPALPDAFVPPIRHFAPIGHVLEGERLAHVVCREHFEMLQHEASAGPPTSGPELGRLQVVTARRDEHGDWYVLFDYVLLSGGSIAWVLDEPPPDDTSAVADREPDTAA